MQSLAVGSYTAAQTRAALLSSIRKVDFRYELLDSSNNVKSDISSYFRQDGNEVRQNSLADIKRTAKFTVLDTAPINWLSDRVKPYMRLLMSDGNYAEWAQGVFLLSSPQRTADPFGQIVREVDAYDQLQILRDDVVTDRYTVAAGVNYISGANAVQALLTSAGITSYSLDPTASTLPAALDWDPGTTKLKIINDLLNAINYGSLWFDQAGVAQAHPYVLPSARATEFTYSDDSQSVIAPNVQDVLDLFGVPNKWVAVVSEADRPVLTSSYTNSNPLSPTSTVSRGRTIVDFRTDISAADQTTLDAAVSRLAALASQVYEQVQFSTALMPMHGDSDALAFNFSELGISKTYIETEWILPLKAGALMTHTMRRVVPV